MKIFNIVWETDGTSIEVLNLPGEVNINDSIEEENIPDFLSDKYGFLIKSFEIDKDNRKEYCMEKANTIWKSIFQSVDITVTMSWGISKRIATYFRKMPALQLVVNGFIHKGSVVITYNEKTDYFEIYFFNKKGKENRKPITDIAFDELGKLLDENIEKPESMQQEEYESKIRESFAEII